MLLPTAVGAYEHGDLENQYTWFESALMHRLKRKSELGIAMVAEFKRNEWRFSQ
jgi:hypothetical protein